MRASILKKGSKDILMKAIYYELYTSHLYKHLAASMQNIAMFGMQTFFEKESEEEIEHYYKIRNYMNDVGEFCSLPSVDAIDEVVSSPGRAIQMAIDTEKNLLDFYQEAYYDACEDNDHMTAQFLLWYIETQYKSYGLYSDLLARYELNSDDKMMFDEFVKNL